MSIAPERIRDEIIKMMETPSASRAMSIWAEFGIFADIAPEITECIGHKQCAHHGETDIFDHTCEAMEAIRATASTPRSIMRIAAMFHDAGKPACAEPRADGEGFTFFGHEAESEKIARRFCERFRFSKADTEMICAIAREHMGIPARGAKAKTIRRFIRRTHFSRIETGRASIFDEIMEMHRADRIARDPDIDEHIEHIRSIKAEMEATAPRMPIDGHDIMEATGATGPDIGRIKRAMEERFDADPSMTREAMIEIMRAEHA
jgi:tRNA nucleotidyltransferase/poly(A) polymerase